MRYIRKPETVDAFQFGADAEVSAPSWFMKELEKEQIFINRVITDGATKVYGCTITTAYGKQRAKMVIILCVLRMAAFFRLRRTYSEHSMKG